MILFQFFLLILIMRRGAFTKIGMIAWSVIVFTKTAIRVAGYVLEHHHNDYTEAEDGDLTMSFIKIGIAISVFLIANKINFVEGPKKEG